MKVAVYSTKEYEKYYFDLANQNKHEIFYIAEPISLSTIDKIEDFKAVCCFVTDKIHRKLIHALVKKGVQLIALRSAGFDHVDVMSAKELNLSVARVPQYSPEAIAEFAIGLILALSRKIHHAYVRGLKYDFSLDNLLGFNLYQKTVGIIGTGNIGTAFAKIMHGFGCRLLAYDISLNQGIRQKLSYVPFEQLLKESDIISLHCVLNKQTHHLIEENALRQMKKGAMLINTGRGALIDTRALINSLKTGHLGYAGIDVYENEGGLFFKNHHDNKPQDALFLELQAMSNVLITPHQAFFTEEAMINITKTTLYNITAFEEGNPKNLVS